MSPIDRRTFVSMTTAATAASLAGASLGAGSAPVAQPGANPRPARAGDDHRCPCVISSGNGARTTAKAMDLIAAGTHPLDAIVEGTKIVEDDPSDMSVGLGGLPNEEGVVQLDASVMDGMLHRAGSVGSLENIKNPAAVALLVMRRTDHVMLVGPGALKFALRMGFKEENLLTDAAREAWLKWRGNLGRDDKWLNDDEREDLGQRKSGPRAEGSAAPRSSPHDARAGGPVIPDSTIPFTWGTIHTSAVTSTGHLAACTSTSGLSWKLPGRLGDSPIVGAGMYCDNAIGSAGATGRGEAVIQVCGAFSVVEHMDRGLSPTEACLAVLKRMADRTREKRLLDDKGRPNFNVTMYALRKDGAYGSASLWKGGSFAVHDGKENRVLESAWLFEK
ncbi:MAG: N(4)-(beta-N-acetylglucosaminyl)-L-asparaginase [Phycisphaerae bacterium]|nr:N(4)-(beta-N-acetylglucosaminyl)-L-asparaginase [Phycisphaerae bacterium]